MIIKVAIIYIYIFFNFFFLELGRRGAIYATEFFHIEQIVREKVLKTLLLFSLGMQFVEMPFSCSK